MLADLYKENIENIKRKKLRSNLFNNRNLLYIILFIYKYIKSKIFLIIIFNI